MKKIFAFAFAALAMVACVKPGNGGNTGGGETPDPKPGDQTELTLDKKTLELKVGETATLVASAKDVTWESSKEEVATVKDGVVTAVAEGNTVITAKSGDLTAKCMVKVSAAEVPGQVTENGVKGSKVWAIVLDQASFESCGDRIAGDIRTDDVENFLYIWPDGTTYAAGDGVGKNAMGNDEGYVSLTCTSAALGWSGLGFCIKREASVAALEALRQEILANPDEYYFHISLKSTDNASHKFYLFDGANAWVVGTANIDGTDPSMNFTRDGKWQDIDIPMAQFTAGLQKPVESGVNVLCALSGNQPGAQLNMDAAYFYKK